MAPASAALCYVLATAKAPVLLMLLLWMEVLPYSRGGRSPGTVRNKTIIAVLLVVQGLVCTWCRRGLDGANPTEVPQQHRGSRVGVLPHAEATW
jgi:hypothetical protein